jgi:hypothetical protein
MNQLSPFTYAFRHKGLSLVLAAGAGLTAWMLSRLDPISILERRT